MKPSKPRCIISSDTFLNQIPPTDSAVEAQKQHEVWQNLCYHFRLGTHYNWGLHSLDQTQDDTNELLRRAAADDAEATEQLLMRHRDRLHRMVAMRLDRRISARIDASDIVQEVMIKAFRTFPEYLATRPIAFYPWLRRLVWEEMMNVYRTHFVAARRSINREQIIDIPLPGESAILLADALVAQQSSPSQHVARDQMNEQVRVSLEKLSPNYRELLTLRYLEQLSIKEIADETGTTQAAVKMRHMRAMQQLAKLLGKFNSSGD